VRSVHHTPKYTILELGEEGEPCWVAAPRLDVEVGDHIAYADAVEVPDFRSETLGRTFERMLLAMYVFKIDGAGRVVPANPHAPSSSVAAPVPDAAASLAETRPRAKPPALGSLCAVADVISHAASLAGQDLTLRGVVASATYDVRPAPGQPPLNWYRLQDQGASRGETLAVCGSVMLQRGETVVVQGRLAVNKRFDAHVHYPAILEGARKLPQVGPQP
jgi:hypothetical protein